MDKMKYERLGNLVKNLDNKRIPLNSAERNTKSKKGTYPYIGANNIVTYINEFIFNEKILCVAEDGGSWGAEQVCANIYVGKTWVNNHAHVLIENGKSDLEYLKFYLNHANLNKHITGTTRGKLTRKELDSIRIPFPSKSEQIRISTILSKAEALIKQRKESIALLDEFLKSTFLEMFGDPVRNEKGWEKGKVEKYTDCIVPGRDKPKSFTGDIPWIRTEDLKNKGFINKSNDKIGLTKEEIREVKGKIIPKGSVIMTCVGQLNVISINESVCIINQQLHSFQCNEGINNIFLMYSLSFQENFMYANASTTTVAYMNKTVCNSIPIIKPSLKLQTQFAQIVERTEALKKQYQASLGELEQLFSSLSQKAFKGELDLSRVEVEEENFDGGFVSIEEAEPIIEVLQKDYQNYLESLPPIRSKDSEMIKKIRDLDFKRKQVGYTVFDENYAKYRVLAPYFEQTETRTFNAIYDYMQEFNDIIYEQIRDFVFKGLTDEKPYFEQVFDSETKKIRHKLLL